MKERYKFIHTNNIHFPSDEEVNDLMDFNDVLLKVRDHQIALELKEMNVYHSGLEYFVLSIIATVVIFVYSNIWHSKPITSDVVNLSEVVKVNDIGTFTNITLAGLLNFDFIPKTKVDEIELETDPRDIILNKVPNSENKKVALMQKKEEQVFRYEYIKAKPVIGFDSLNYFIASNIKYPDEDVFHRNQGTVVIEFEIHESGMAQNFKVMHGLSEDINSEVMRVIKRMPEWTPATLNGEPVVSLFRMPVTFKIDNSESIDYKLIKAEPVIGFNSLYEYFKSELEYPSEMMLDSIGGMVMVQFDITERGFVDNIKIVEKSQKQFEKEAIRVIRRMPLWRPAYLNGKPIKTTSMLPISFRID